jgi:hypothetical protein
MIAIDDRSVVADSGHVSVMRRPVVSSHTSPF